ncbi:MAG: PH domain-containing protein [bacterium]|nr:PH domain-containing protein [bacterium]
MITEQQYPIQLRWVHKEILGSILKEFILVVFGYVFIWLKTGDDLSVKQQQNIFYFLQNNAVYLVLLLLASAVIYPILKRATFSYALEDDYLTVRQGIITRQERHIPYNVIQNIIISRNLDDLIFGLVTITVENASAGGGYSQPRGFNTTGQPGSSSNHIVIVGLQTADATALREAILAKMLANPDSTDSGL